MCDNPKCFAYTEAFKTKKEAVERWNNRPAEEAKTARIAELEAERDRLREALQEIISCQPEMCLARYCCRKCESMAEIARKALKGAGEC